MTYIIVSHLSPVFAFPFCFSECLYFDVLMCNLGCPQPYCRAVAWQITKMTLCPELHLHYALPGCMIVELYLKLFPITTENLGLVSLLY